MLQKHTRFTVESGPRYAENGAGALRRREVIVKTTTIERRKTEKAGKNETISEQLSGITVKTTTKKCALRSEEEETLYIRKSMEEEEDK